MLEQTVTKTAIRAVPAMPKDVKGLRKALKDIAPLIKKAQESLSSLPLRDVPHKITGEPIKCRFATSEELQRIIMKTCRGRIVVNTVPVQLGNDPAVMAQIAILTEEGYVVLPSATASQRVEQSFIEKPLLSAESRAIRRALRELGLRAEYETYDPEDDEARYKASQNSAKDIDLDQVEPKAEVVTDFNDPTDIKSDKDSSLDDEDIPQKPSDKKTDPANNKAEKKPVAESEKKTKSRAKTSSKAKSSPRGKTTKSVVLPKKPLSLTPDFEHKKWPSKQDLMYHNIILEALSKEKTKLKMTMDTFVQQVFGTEKPPEYKRLTTFSNQELEMMYQFYIIQQGKV